MQMPNTGDFLRIRTSTKILMIFVVSRGF